MRRVESEGLGSNELVERRADGIVTSEVGKAVGLMQGSSLQGD